MQSCLGLYIEDKLIKYAKVSKSNDKLKVESFGIKFYENLNNSIEEIIEETYSFKTPICTNLLDEKYNTMEVFSLLSKKDKDGIVKTEFENICYQKEENKNIYETRYLYSNEVKQGDKQQIIHISSPKTFIAQRKNQLSKSKLTGIYPVSTTLVELIKNSKKNNYLIVNIEKNTTITKVVKGEITEIDVLDVGSKDILDNINNKENSYSKSYNICKTATIYTDTDKDLQMEENEYLEEIMPTLYKIVTEVRKRVDMSLQSLEKVYITGTGAIVNNIDIYFKEYLGNIVCEILRPSFIANTSKINIKDYIEVNSPISMTLEYLNGKKDFNFVQESVFDNFKQLLSSDITKIDFRKVSESYNKAFEKLDNTFNIALFTSILITILYAGSAIFLEQKISEKSNEADNSINETQQEIAQIDTYTTNFNSKISYYQNILSSSQISSTDTTTDDKRYKNTIPNLLNNLMAVIPKSVQLTSIENTTNTHIVITAKSSQYEQIAYFKTKLKVDGILENVVSDVGTSNGGVLTVTIEGELP